ncbi:hypothetical protein EJ08DRAFT_330109 [Tothia fuscella]|uniref:Uncharacterized protein n=1 Tax=Tothia fuscella TaxID=1048955 RepID=A0A9P4TVR4_9PEZI|nr:hypothetical protein EJ08DRAFT_330109 [Tothia fuscella]
MSRRCSHCTSTCSSFSENPLLYSPRSPRYASRFEEPTVLRLYQPRGSLHGPRRPSRIEYNHRYVQRLFTQLQTEEHLKRGYKNAAKRRVTMLREMIDMIRTKKKMRIERLKGIEMALNHLRDDFRAGIREQDLERWSERAAEGVAELLALEG